MISRTTDMGLSADTAESAQLVIYLSPAFPNDLTALSKNECTQLMSRVLFHINLMEDFLRS